MKGLLLALQFFSAVPVKKELSLGRKEVTAMYSALPFVGAGIGLAMYAMSVLALDVIGVSPLLAAVFIVLTAILLTGGLHLDGLADTSDAFFSYRDREKRLAILDDPRIGAFGTMVLLLLIIVKITLMNELITSGKLDIVYFLLIPFLARSAMNVYFTTVPLAKSEGLAHFFKEKMASRTVTILSVLSVCLMLVAAGVLLNDFIIPTAFFVLLTVVIYLYSRWSMKHFGGVTGDLSGALIEGLEALLWLMVIILM